MEAIADKIRHYRKTFRPPLFYALGSLAFWLSTVLATIILGLLLYDVYASIVEVAFPLAHPGKGWLFTAEVPMVFGVMQAYIQGSDRRYRSLNPTARYVHFRTPQDAVAKEKHAYFHATFKHDGDLRLLAKQLIEEWEWRRELKLRAKEPLERAALGFFNLPSPANFAAYITGLVAVLAGIIIATLSSDSIVADLGQFVIDASQLTTQMWLAIVLPFALCVVPGALILVGIKQIGQMLLEKVNDQYLGHTAFYRFISELLELHDRGEPMLLRGTRTWAYWTIRLTTAPLKDCPRIWGRIRRSKAWAKRGSASPRAYQR